MNLEAVKWLWCLSVAGWAVVTDLRSHKIKNYTAAIGAVVGILLNLADVTSALVGMAVPLVLIPLFAARMMGAGDIKLLCAMGAIMRFPDIVSIILYSFVFCGVYILVNAAVRHGLRDLLSGVWQDLRFLILTRRPGAGSQTGKRLPMAVPIAAAALLVIGNMIWRRIQ